MRMARTTATLQEARTADLPGEQPALNYRPGNPHRRRSRTAGDSINIDTKPAQDLLRHRPSPAWCARFVPPGRYEPIRLASTTLPTAPRPDRLDDRAGRNPPGRPIDRSAGLIAPSRVVINAVGRVGDHKVRRDATEHARNVGRHCAVAAEQSMTAEHP